MKNTTLCYIENERGDYLMLHRVKKENDCNRDKWIGVGGKFEDGESPEECVLRETLEETGADAHCLALPAGSSRSSPNRWENGVHAPVHRDGLDGEAACVRRGGARVGEP